MSLEVQPLGIRLPPRPKFGVGLLVTLLGLFLILACRAGYLAPRPLPAPWGLLIVTFIWIRHRGLLWVAGFGVSLVFFVERFVPYFEPTPGSMPPLDSRLVDFLLIATQVMIMCAVMHLLISSIEVIERRSKLLLMANAELAAVWRTAPVGLLITNTDMTEVRINPHGAKMLGTAANENIATELAKGRFVLWADGRPMPLEQTPLIRAARENVFVEPAEYELVTPVGRIAVQGAAAPIRASNIPMGWRMTAAQKFDPESREGAVGAVVAFVDITSAKQLQRELDLRRREAEEASVRKTRFLSSVSHDIRTPANAISLLAELLSHAANSPGMESEIPKFARDLRGSAQRLVDLVSDVLDFTRLDTGRVELVETVFDLGELMREEVNQAVVLAGPKGLAVKYEEMPEPIFVRTDRVKLGRVMGNLLSNGIKYTPVGEVTIKAERTAASDVVLRVKDTGIGIPPDAIGRVFDEFYQVRSNANSRDPARAGSGLGLAICRRLSNAMGIRLDVESEVGKGSTFTLTIPEPLTVLRSRELRRH